MSNHLIFLRWIGASNSVKEVSDKAVNEVMTEGLARNQKTVIASPP